LAPQHRLDPAHLLELCSTQPARFKLAGATGIEVRCTPEEAADFFPFLEWCLSRIAPT
jgi:hypothetical protein